MKDIKEIKEYGYKVLVKDLKTSHISIESYETYDDMQSRTMALDLQKIPYLSFYDFTDETMQPIEMDTMKAGLLNTLSNIYDDIYNDVDIEDIQWTIRDTISKYQ